MAQRAIVRALVFTAGCALGQSGILKGATSPAEQAAAIQAVREYALNYTRRLPNYTCTLTTGQTMRQPNSITSPRLTVVEEQLSFLDGREIRKVTRVNGRPAPTGDEPEGMSRGEFGNLLDIIFEPATGAEVRWDRAATMNRRSVDVFAFHVPQSSGYVLTGSRGDIQVPFEGFVYADAQTHAVLRIQMKCTMIPDNSEIRTVDLTLDYKAARVAGQEFILPSEFVLHFLNYREDRQHINDGRFSAYRRFSADATIQFEGDKQ